MLGSFESCIFMVRNHISSILIIALRTSSAELVLSRIGTLTGVTV